MQPIVSIISIVFVFLYTSSVDCSKLELNYREKSTNGRRFSSGSPGSCPDGSIPIQGRCRSISSRNSLCSGDHVVVDGHCRKVYLRGNRNCDENYETIENNCVELIPDSIACPNGSKRIRDECRAVSNQDYLCPEGSRMIRGMCRVVTTSRGNCPENYEFVNGACREK